MLNREGNGTTNWRPFREPHIDAKVVCRAGVLVKIGAFPHRAPVLKVVTPDDGSFALAAKVIDPILKEDRVG
jgi:hypothetical protein